MTFANFLSDWSAEMREDNDRAERIAHCQYMLDKIDADLALMRANGTYEYPGTTMTTPIASALVTRRINWLAALMKARKV
jgi:hypothetical protein